MNIKLIRNAMFITVIIMVISLMGKTSAHDVRASHVIQPSNNVQLMIER